jgi:DNA-binding transcriptional ArsR family regulator
MKDIDPRLLRFFDALADETRLKILISISETPLTVSEIHHALGTERITLSGVSHQLRLMTDLDIVVPEKSGREKRFSLSKKYCWCILRDAFRQLRKGKCPHCSDIEKTGGLLIIR